MKIRFFAIFAFFFLLFIAVPFLAQADYTCTCTYSADDSCYPGDTWTSPSDSSYSDPWMTISCTPNSNPSCSANYQQYCTKSNACSTTVGQYTCSGVCDAAEPTGPSNYGQTCTSSANACGQTGTGTIQCNGTCSATTPAVPSNYGQSCTKSNACSSTFGTYDCSGTCSAADPTPVPSNYGQTCTSSPNSCGQTNTGTIQCNGTCSATAPSDSSCAPPPPPPPPSDTTSPSVSISGSPASWQSSNATASISCSDSSGCESSGNWRWLTRETYISSCSSFALSDYTGTGTSIGITNHVWMCATAQDINGNRGYSSPAEFKVDKTQPVSSITNPAAGSWQKTNFTVSVSDSDSGGSGLSSCYYGVYSNGGWAVALGTARTCGSALTITAGTSGSCSNAGTNKCDVWTYSRDSSGNESPIAARYFSIGDPVVSFEAAPSVINQGQSVQLTALCWGACEGKTASLWTSLTTAGPSSVIIDSCVVNGGSCSKTFTPGVTGNVGFWATVDINGNGNTNDSGETSNTATVNVTSCKKTNTPLREDTSSVTLSNGFICSLNITHLSENKTQNVAVSYEDKGAGSDGTRNFRSLEIDEEPFGQGDCDMDLNLKNSWRSPTQGIFNIRSEPQNYGSGNNRVLGYGYQISSSNCVFASAQQKTCASDPSTGFSCPSESQGTFSFSLDRRLVKAMGYLDSWSGFNPGVSANHEFDYSIVECLNSNHCTADPSKAKCNLDPAVSAFPQNTCVDSINPTSLIEDEFYFSPSPAKRTTDNTYWLKAGTYAIDLADSDSGPAGIDTAQCSYMIDDLGRTGEASANPRTRTCSNGPTPSTITITVGPTGDCQTQGDNSCRLTAKTIDKAGNSTTSAPLELNIDYTVPTAQ